MAWAEPSIILALFAGRDTSKMRANSNDDQPLWFLNPLVVRLRIRKLRKTHCLRILDFFFRPMTDENRLATPFDG